MGTLCPRDVTEPSVTERTVDGIDGGVAKQPDAPENPGTMERIRALAR